MIDVIVFDLAEVYLRGMVGVKDLLARPLGVDESVIMPSLAGKKRDLLFRGKITEEEYWQRVIEENGYNTSVDFLKQAIRQNFQRIDGVEEIIRGLKASYRLGLLSDHCREWIAYCEEHFPIRNLFDICCYSFEEGITKRDPKIYLKVLRRLEADPGRIIYVDNENYNLDTAKLAGITNTILFYDAPSLRRDLDSYGVISVAR